MLFVVKGDGIENDKDKELLLNNLDWLIETIETTNKSKINEIIPNIQSLYVEYKNKVGDKLTDKEIASIISFKWFEDMKNNKKLIKQLTPFIMSFGLSILQLILYNIMKSLLEMYDKQRSVIGDEYNKCVDIWRECGIIEPICVISICYNEFCKHFEFLLSSNPKHQNNCSKCCSKWASLTLYKVNEPFSSLKLEGKDLSVFLSSYIERISSLPIEVVPECYINNVQIDVFLKESQTIFECKVYEDREITTYEKVLNMYKEAYMQLSKSLKNTRLKRGYIVTNLKLNQSLISKLEGETKGIVEDQEIEIKLTAGSSSKELLENLSNKLKELGLIK